MPAIGLGTSVSAFGPFVFLVLTFDQFSTTSLPPDQAEVEATVKTALQIGYRHIDCAAVYQNESAVGRGIKASGIPREDIFVRTPMIVCSLKIKFTRCRSRVNSGIRSMIQST
jgi:diketogulonate reductase-like aldo/keto reductase